MRDATNQEVKSSLEEAKYSLEDEFHQLFTEAVDNLSIEHDEDREFQTAIIYSGIFDSIRSKLKKEIEKAQSKLDAISRAAPLMRSLLEENDELSDTVDEQKKISPEEKENALMATIKRNNDLLEMLSRARVIVEDTEQGFSYRYVFNPLDRTPAADMYMDTQFPQLVKEIAEMLKTKNLEEIKKKLLINQWIQCMGHEFMEMSFLFDELTRQYRDRHAGAAYNCTAEALAECLPNDVSQLRELKKAIEKLSGLFEFDREYIGLRLMSMQTAVDEKLRSIPQYGRSKQDEEKIDESTINPSPAFMPKQPVGAGEELLEQILQWPQIQARIMSSMKRDRLFFIHNLLRIHKYCGEKNKNALLDILHHIDRHKESKKPLTDQALEDQIIKLILESHDMQDRADWRLDIKYILFNMAHNIPDQDLTVVYESADQKQESVSELKSLEELQKARKSAYNYCKKQILKPSNLYAVEKEIFAWAKAAYAYEDKKRQNDPSSARLDRLTRFLNKGRTDSLYRQENISFLEQIISAKGDVSKVTVEISKENNDTVAKQFRRLKALYDVHVQNHERVQKLTVVSSHLPQESALRDEAQRTMDFPDAKPDDSGTPSAGDSQHSADMSPDAFELADGRVSPTSPIIALDDTTPAPDADVSHEVEVKVEDGDLLDSPAEQPKEEKDAKEEEAAKAALLREEEEKRLRLLEEAAKREKQKAEEEAQDNAKFTLAQEAHKEKINKRKAEIKEMLEGDFGDLLNETFDLYVPAPEYHNLEKQPFLRELLVPDSEARKGLVPDNKETGDREKRLLFYKLGDTALLDLGYSQEIHDEHKTLSDHLCRFINTIRDDPPDTARLRHFLARFKLEGMLIHEYADEMYTDVQDAIKIYLRSRDVKRVDHLEERARNQINELQEAKTFAALHNCISKIKLDSNGIQLLDALEKKEVMARLEKRGLISHIRKKNFFGKTTWAKPEKSTNGYVNFYKFPEEAPHEKVLSYNWLMTKATNEEMRKGELGHFMPWLFPTITSSDYDPEGILPQWGSDEEMREFETNAELKPRVERSFLRMLDFFGFEKEWDGSIVPKASDEEAPKPPIYTQSIHYLQWIARMLESLLYFKLGHLAVALYCALVEANNKEQREEYKIPQKSLDIWEQKFPENLKAALHLAAKEEKEEKSESPEGVERMLAKQAAARRQAMQGERAPAKSFVESPDRFLGALPGLTPSASPVAAQPREQASVAVEDQSTLS